MSACMIFARATYRVYSTRVEAHGTPAVKGVARWSFLRFCAFRGEVPAGSPPAYRPSLLGRLRRRFPRVIAAEHAQRAIDSCNRLTAIGLRDRAVLLLLARSGLRACEIIRLTLEDIDWDLAQLRAFTAKEGWAAGAYCRCPPMLAVPLPHICSTAGRPVKTDTSSFVPWRRSAVCWMDRTAWARSCALQFERRRSMHRIVARINFDMHWPLTCCGKARRCRGSAKCCATAARRPPASMPSCKFGSAANRGHGLARGAR